MRSAIRDYRAGEYKPLTAAARAQNLPNSTVQHRFKGRTSRLDTANNNQLLTKEQEQVLVLWLIDLQKQPVPANSTLIRSLVREMLVRNGVDKPIGQHWITRFYKRHPGLEYGKSQPLSKYRARGLDLVTIDTFFDVFTDLRTQYQILDDNI